MFLVSLYTSYHVIYINTLLKAYPVTHIQFSVHTRLRSLHLETVKMLQYSICTL